MSSEQLTLSLRIKDSDLRRQMQQMEEVFKKVGSQTGTIRPGFDQFRKLNEDIAKMQIPLTSQVEAGQSLLGPLKNIAKHVLPLAGIGLGIVAMVALSQKSSGILTGTFKIIQTSMLLFLKPLADIIGLFFQPLAVMLITKLAIPFFQFMKPFYQDAKGAGKSFAAFFEDPSGSLVGLAGTISEKLGPVINKVFGEGGLLNTVGAKVLEVFNKIDFSSLSDKITTKLEAAFNKIDFAGLSEKALDIFQKLNFGELFGKLLDKSLGIVGALPWPKMVNSVLDSIENIPWTKVVNKVGDVLSKIPWGKLIDVIGEVLKTIATTSIKRGLAVFASVFDKIGITANTTLRTALFQLSEFFGNVQTQVGSILTPAWEAVTSTSGFISDLMTQVGEKLEEMRGGPVETIFNTFTAISNKIKEVFQIIQNAINTIRSLIPISGRAKTGNRFRSFQEGGLISEPVIGVGQNTGDLFSFAERGPELVIPKGKVGKTGNNVTINNYISGNTLSNDMDLDRVASQLNNKIMNMLTAVGVV